MGLTLLYLSGAAAGRSVIVYQLTQSDKELWLEGSGPQEKSIPSTAPCVYTHTHTHTHTVVKQLYYSLFLDLHGKCPEVKERCEEEFIRTHNTLSPLLLCRRGQCPRTEGGEERKHWRPPTTRCVADADGDLFPIKFIHENNYVALVSVRHRFGSITPHRALCVRRDHFHSQTPVHPSFPPNPSFPLQS